MSNMFSSRKGPLLIAGGIFSGLLYMTYGGSQQPRPRAQAQAAHDAHDARSSSSSPEPVPVSETLQAVAGTGGGGSNTRGRDEVEQSRGEHDRGDTRLYSQSPSAHSKREAAKVK
ncbi:hypothetical protein C8A00DRAFT_14087 [Chaetomidium leptoderma]|uniref:Uncharacterized protein n=1 Tax=Chaetomidium leptoderma TaxID=669021 RepID=A0AAN6VP24_9PEZI|nr:hypothetical protein C8A00DRAFT_14087 [Chaetomidium leptoderma]